MDGRGFNGLIWGRGEVAGFLNTVMNFGFHKMGGGISRVTQKQLIFYFSFTVHFSSLLSLPTNAHI
jgi:hypothetical protein